MFSFKILIFEHFYRVVICEIHVMGWEWHFYTYYGMGMGMGMAFLFFTN